MKLSHCPYDDHDKEQTCEYYERGDEERLGCYCKYMLDDQCACYKRIQAAQDVRQ